MAHNFDWHTEDDGPWEDLAPQGPVSPKRPKRRWWFGLVAMMLLTAVAGLVYRQAQLQVQKTTQALEQDVLSSYRLMSQAAQRGDSDLFTSLLSGRDVAWTAAQMALFKQKALVDRPEFGLYAPSAPAVATDVITVTLSPELQEAEMVVAQPYQVPGEEGVVILQQTAVYRLGSVRWLLAPPTADFWGEAQTYESDLLTLHYPLRDRAVVEQLAADLPAWVNKMCAQVAGLDCPTNMHVDLTFSTQVQTLAEETLARTMTLDGNDWQLALPTPTLVGLPTSEASYRLLLRGYAEQLISTILISQTSWECCQHYIVFQPLLRYQLAQLGLQTWSVTAQDYQQVVTSAPSLGVLRPLWDRPGDILPTPAQQQIASTMVDYLLHAVPNAQPLAMMKALQPDLGLLSWLGVLFPEGTTLFAGPPVFDTMDQRWQQYAAMASLTSAEPPPVSLPGQSLYLLCLTPDERDGVRESTLYRYDQAAWLQALTLPGFVIAAPLPSAGGLILQQFGLEGPTWQTSYWLNGRLSPLTTPADVGSVSFGQTDPNGRYLINYTFPPEGNRLAFTTLDLDNCQTSGCRQQTVPGLPVWSPNGRHMLLTTQVDQQLHYLQLYDRTIVFDSAATNFATELFLAETAVGQSTPSGDLIPLGSGYAPFWLNNTQFGYIRQTPVRSGLNNRDLVLATVGKTAPQLLLTADDLAANLNDGTTADHLRIQYLLPHPQSDNGLLVIALDNSRQTFYVWSFAWQTGELTLHGFFRSQFNYTVGISPNGRWLTILSNESENFSPSGNFLQLINLETHKNQRYRAAWSFFAPSLTYHWSNDGNWLAFPVNETTVALAVPDADYLQLLYPGVNNCQSVTWASD